MVIGVPGLGATGHLLCLKQSADICPDWFPSSTKVRIKPHPLLCVVMTVTCDPKAITLVSAPECAAQVQTWQCVGPMRSKPCARDPFPLGTELGWGVQAARGQGQEATVMHCVSIHAAP